MPELPEVETVARQLEPRLLAKRIERIRILDEKLKSLPKPQLAGARITAVERRGKQVVFALRQAAWDHEAYLVFHLRMTGRLLCHEVAESDDFPPPHTRAIFHCGEQRLAFVDVRRFGTIQFCKKLSDFIGTGLEPLDAQFKPSLLGKLIDNSRQEIKIWLLRQDKVLGIGNIYASEILFEASISPNRSACSLSSEELVKLCRSIKKVLKKAIKHCGTSFSDFQDSQGKIGDYQRFLKVYLRAGESCQRCPSQIEKIRQGQRSTFFCPTCQQ